MSQTAGTCRFFMHLYSHTSAFRSRCPVFGALNVQRTDGKFGFSRGVFVGFAGRLVFEAGFSECEGWGGKGSPGWDGGICIVLGY